jgi:hypothetical protein
LSSNDDSFFSTPVIALGISSNLILFSSMLIIFYDF